MDQKVNRIQTTERLLTHQRVNESVHRQSPHHREMVLALPLPLHRSKPLGRIAPHDRWQQVEARFINKYKPSALLLGLLSDARPRLHGPAPDGDLVTLNGPKQWYLRRPADLLKQTTDLASAVADAELFDQHRAHAAGSPNLPQESVSLGPMPQKVRNEPYLFRRQFGWPTSAQPSDQ